MLKKSLLITLIFILICGIYYAGLASDLDLTSIREKYALAFKNGRSPLLFTALFIASYILCAALSIPGATALTMAGGALFGLPLGVLIVTFSATIGAALAFGTSRYLFRDLIQRRYGDKISTINAGMEKEGWVYLLTLRLIPIFPFFLINLAMGLTPIRLSTFIMTSFFGMIPAIAVFANAGTQLAKIDSVQDVVSPETFTALALLGLVPLASRFMLRRWKRYRILKPYKKPKSFDYNLVVIGAGSAGLVASYIAAAAKAKVLLIEKHKMGGDCLNTGCVPSKALIKSAHVARLMQRHGDFGFKTVTYHHEFREIMARVRRVIKTVEPHDSVARYTELGVECIQGEARLKSPYEVAIGGRTVTTRSIILATGARPLVPSLPGLEKVRYFTSDTLWLLEELPKRFLVLGGGPIGCELAQAFARLGSSVTIVEMKPRLMIREDEDVSEHVERKFKHESIRVLTGAKARSFESSTALSVETERGTEIVEFDVVFFALGRKSSLSVPGASELGIKLGQQGIECDEYLQTRVPTIYACGDLAGPYQFTHVAAHQAWFASVNALFGSLKRFKADYRVIPWCTFTDPEVARVGLSEGEAKEKNIEYEITKYPIEDLDRAIAEDEAEGFVKVLTRPGTDRILGVTIVGSRAGDLIAEYVLAMKHGIGLKKILGTIHIYPTFSEANKYAAGEWRRAHQPKGLLNWVARFHSWRRG